MLDIPLLAFIIMKNNNQINEHGVKCMLGMRSYKTRFDKSCICILMFVEICKI